MKDRDAAKQARDRSRYEADKARQAAERAAVIEQQQRREREGRGGW